MEKKYDEIYYRKNRERILKQCKQYEQKNREAVRKRHRKYYLKNIEKIKQYRLKNRKKVRESHRRYSMRLNNGNASLSNVIMNTLGRRCKVCGITKNLKIHHLTYKNPTIRDVEVRCHSCNSRKDI